MGNAGNLDAATETSGEAPRIDTNAQANAMTDGICIIGGVVRLRRQGAEDARAALREHPGVEIHAEDAQARLVVTLECEGWRQAQRWMEQIQEMPGVLQFTPVYQQWEPTMDDRQR